MRILSRRQLGRWLPAFIVVVELGRAGSVSARISESRVPAGALVKFEEPSVWDRYKLYILAAMSVLLAQTALIAGLLVQRSRRRQAEVQVRERLSALRMRYERIRGFGGRLLNAQETERSRIARDLHDDIGQQLALLAIDLKLLGDRISDSGEPLASEALTRVHGIASSVHDISHRLHPAKLRLIGLVSALNGLAREMSKPGTTIIFVHEGVAAPLPPDLTVCLFRVVQEALQNAVTYSSAREVTVHLNLGDALVAVSIVDDGAGFDVDAAWGKGLGLISMLERVEAQGGTIEIRSRPGQGTELEILAPLRAVLPIPHSPSNPLRLT